MNITERKMVLEALLTQASNESNLYWLLLSIFLSIIWVVYLTYYNSRVVGLFMTIILNRFITFGHFKIGSFSISVLSGKIMFRNVHLLTENYSIRVKLGSIIFRWWWPLVNKNFDEDLSRSDTRLSVYLEKVEFHIYNHSSNFSRLEQIFGLDQIILPTKTQSPDNTLSKVELNKNKWAWRNLLPVIKVEISDGKVILGNYLMPQSLLLSTRDLNLVYTTKPASTPFDLFMHIIKGKADNFKVMWVPSPKYTGKSEMPPRCMGEGFAVLQSNQVEFYYYQDEAGLVPYEPESVYLANGDVVSIRTWPCWGMDFKCGKNTDISYGPWCERQREFLNRFFYPPDYEPLLAMVPPSPGQMRVFRDFDFKLSFQNNTNIDLLFTKSTETQALHMVCKPGSYLEFTYPMFLDNDGCTLVVTGQLMHLESSTSLKFRNFLECETLEFVVKTFYLSNWNDPQEYVYDLTACKLTAYIIYQHIDFIGDLISDWSSKERPDIFTFVPYTCEVNLMVKEFEGIIMVNQWNWVDCFGTAAENSQMAVRGDTFDLSLILPYDDYLPDTLLTKFFLRLESLEGLLFLPETHTSRHLLISLWENMKVLTREGDIESGKDQLKSKKWYRVCSRQDGWIPVITTPIVALSLEYCYHPIPSLFTGKELGSFNVEDIDTNELTLNPFKLVPLRPLRTHLNLKKKGVASVSPGMAANNQFDVGNMEPDVFSIEFEVGPTAVYAYGTLIMLFLNFKDSYLGDFQKVSDLEKNIEATTNASFHEDSENNADLDLASHGDDDIRMHRPFSVVLHLTLHDIHGHLVKNCTENGPPCPCFFLERVVFEMNKQYNETKLQVNLSSIMVVCLDTVERPPQHRHLSRGFLTLSSLQVRGHAMFSHEGLPIKAETLEYAWLIEVVVGDLVGRLTTLQLKIIMESLQTFIFLAEDKENKLVCPNAFELCQHMLDQNECVKTGNNLLSPCPTVSDLKYEFIRLSLDCVDIHMVESGSALNLKIVPVRLSRCNLFSQTSRENVTLLLPSVSLKHYVSSNSVTSNISENLQTWLEVGGVNLGPLFIDLSKTLENPHFVAAQIDFLRLHDQRTHRLNFLWDSVKCGCVGGCEFFGKNRNGESFFNPSENDLLLNTNVAVPHIFENSTHGYGYGQSILKSGKSIFTQKPLSAAEYLNEIIKPNSGEAIEEPTLDDKKFPITHRYFAKVKPVISMVRAEQEGLSEWKSRLTLSSDEIDEDYGDSDQPDTLESLDSIMEGNSEILRMSQVDSVPRIKTLNSPSLLLRLKDKSSIMHPKIRRDVKSVIMETKRQGLQNRWHSEKELRSKGIFPPYSFEPVNESKGSVYENAVESVKSEKSASNDSFKSAVSFNPLPAKEDKKSLESFSLRISNNSVDKSSKMTTQKTFKKQLGTIRGRDSRTDNLRTSRDLLFMTKQAIRKMTAQMPDKPKSLRLESNKVTVPKISNTKENLCMTELNPTGDIIGSSLLVDCYKCYMAKLHCPNWSSTLPVNTSLTIKSQTPHFDYQNELNFCVPHFVPLSKGLDCHSIMSGDLPKKKSEETEQDTIYRRHIDQRLSRNSTVYSGHWKKKEEGKKVDDWVVVVQLDKSLDVMLSPIMLEALNRYIDSTTAYVESMHASSIIDLLHINCLSALTKQEDKNTTLTSCLNAFTETAEVSKTIDKYQMDSLHLKVNLPQINVSFMQVCSVNDKIPNIKEASDLTSVSFLSVSFNNSTLNFFHNTEIKTTSTILMSNAKDSKNKKIPEGFFEGNLMMFSNRIGVGRKKMNDLRTRLKNTNTCIVKCKTFSESRKTNLVLQVKLSQMHVQLRRSKNLSGNIADLLSFTSIPPTSSKVFFSFKGAHEMQEDKSLVPYSWDLYKKEKSLRQENKGAANQSTPLKKEEAKGINDVIGLIMFECGLEGISFDLAQRFGYIDDQQSSSFDKPKSLKSVSNPELHYQNANKNADVPKNYKSTSKLPRLVSHSLKTINSNLGLDGKYASFLSGKYSKKDKTIGGSYVSLSAYKKKEVLKGDATSVALEIKAVWFNFAAPSSVKEMRYITKKQNWNLLSTASPSILAWINPCNQAISAFNTANDKFLRRQYLVMASLMTDALDVQAIHLMTKSKYNKTSWESKYLQDEPSSQLLTVLRRYVNTVGVGALEECFHEPVVPQNNILKNGILVLTRQWKNVLYLPMFDDNSYKSKKKVKVAYAVPLVQNHYYQDSKESSLDNHLNQSLHASEDRRYSGDNVDNLDVPDAVDEKTSLLKAEEGSFLAPKPSVSEFASPSGIQQKPSPIDLVRIDTMGKFSFQHLDTDIIEEETLLKKKETDKEEYKETYKEAYKEAYKDGSNNSVNLSGSTDHDPAYHNNILINNNILNNINITSNNNNTSFNNINNTSFSNVNNTSYNNNNSFNNLNNSSFNNVNNISFNNNNNDTSQEPSVFCLPNSKNKNMADLHHWMTKQHESVANNTNNTHNNQPLKTHVRKKKGDDVNMKASEKLMQANKSVIASSSLQLVDSQVLFKPLLDAMGLHLHPVKMSTIMKKFGGELSSTAFLKELRVEIVDSQTSFAQRRKRNPKQNVSRTKTSLLCKSFEVTLSMIDILDFEDNLKDHKLHVHPNRYAYNQENEPVLLKTVQMTKDVFDQFENKHITTKVDFNVMSESVTQHVNMSLLRLVHQFTTMVQCLANSQCKQALESPTCFSTPQSANEPRLNPFTPSSPKPYQPPAKSYSPTLENFETIDKMEKGKNVKKVFKVEAVSFMDDAKNIPKCWQNLYHLLNLYNNMVDTNKPFERPVISIIEDGGKEVFRNKRKHFYKTTQITQGLTAKDRIPIILFGSAHLKRISISAVLSGLKLQADLQNGHASFTHREKLVEFAKKKCTESSMTLAINQTNVTLYEGLNQSSQQIVVSVKISRSSALFSSFIKKSNPNCFFLLHMGAIAINIPQHPVALHKMVVHSSKRLSSTLQEFIYISNKTRFADTGTTPNTAFSQQNDNNNKNSDANKHPSTSYATFKSHPLASHNIPPSHSSYPTNVCNSNLNTPLEMNSLPKNPAKMNNKAIEVHFYAKLKGFAIEASLLPSLKAQYQMEAVTSSGVVGGKSKFIINLLNHSLSFSSQVNVTSIIPNSAKICLPPVTVKGEYRLFHEQVVGLRTQQNSCYLHSQVHQLHIPHNESSRLVLREGDYLKATADIGAFVHVLTTDLLNHLVFVQKVFMKEINEVLQKVSGSDQPVQIWSDNFSINSSPSKKPLLYSFILKMKGLQITATTPTNNAVRFETGEIEVEMSNRVEKALKSDSPVEPTTSEVPRKMSKKVVTDTSLKGTKSKTCVNFENVTNTKKAECTDNKPDTSNYVFVPAQEKPPKIFLQMKVDLNLALGTLIKHPIFEEAEPEFPHLASFSTSILLRNALQDEMIAGATMDQEALLINLKRPIIFVLPSAFDKAILVWLNYRNAYEYWTEQRMGLNSEIKVATRQVFTRLPPINESSLSVLFLQITIDDLGICLPMAPFVQPGLAAGKEDCCSYGALVLTLEKTQISACSFKCFVCKGRFTDFCLRFAEDFHITYDDWKPEKFSDYVINALVVPNGTFELCSRTDNRRESIEAIVPRRRNNVSRVNAKWILNILWQMKGIDIHMDTSIGKKLNIVWNTLTSLAGDVRDVTDETQFKHMQEPVKPDYQQPSRKHSLLNEDLPDFVYNANLDPKTRTRLIEKEMNEQAKVVQDLKALGASKNTVEEEEDKLKSLQKALFHDFRKDILKKFKKPGGRLQMPETLLRDHKHLRSSSFAAVSPDSQSSSYTKKSDTFSLEIPNNHLRTQSADVSRFKSPLPSNHIIPVISSKSDITYTTKLPNDPSNDSKEKIEEAQVFDLFTKYKAPRPFVNKEHSGVVLENIPDVENESFEESSSEGSVISDLRSTTAQSNQKIVEPAIDFELDVKAEIESGKCVLHPKDIKQEQDQTRSKSKSAGSPKGQEKKKSKRNTEMNRAMTNNTVFYIPGVEVKLHYNSKTISSIETFSTDNEKYKKFLAVKKANLYAWLSIQKLPEEMLISTSILDFLEQAIEPIESFKKLYTASEDNSNDIFHEEGLLGTKEHASFPVEVVVSIQVQPSVIRFTCLPLSRVECLFQLPSLDVIFSTKKIDQTHHNKYDSSSGHGGLCVSVCMTNISLYIFHPYGGGQRKANVFPKNLESSPVKSQDTSTLIENRKDSLSLNIEFLKLNISRSRKVSSKQFKASKTDKPQQHLSNNVRFSLICNIGSASFKYDMRKLTEILALPKAWYRRSLARRLFLGEEMAVVDREAPSDGDVFSNMSASSSDSSLLDNTTDSSRGEHIPQKKSSEHSKKIKNKSKSSVGKNTLVSLHKPSKTSNSWQTLVLFSINLPQLDVMINMSNAMGNTIWSTKGLQYHSRLMVDSEGYKNANMFVGLSSSKLESKGGIIGGLIELENVHSEILIKEDPGKEPEHKVSVNVHTLEVRLDYMGSTFLIGRLSELTFQLKDEWKFKADNQTKSAQPNQDVVSLMMFVHCKLSLDRFHLMISKSTTSDFLKMIHKLEEFFTQQLTSGKRALLNFASTPIRPKIKKEEAPTTVSGDKQQQQASHYRHWQSVFNGLTCCKLAIFPFSMPHMKAIVGGSANLVGKNITLACFHGINFKTKSWALFTMDEPNIMFETEAINLSHEGKQATHIVQSLTFQLRGSDNDMSRKNKMATVYKLSRGYYMPPAFTSVQEWFNYAFATSDIKGLDSFPNVPSPSQSLLGSPVTTSQFDTGKKTALKRNVYKHETETIFILPSFRMYLKTFHTQEEKAPEGDFHPVVDFSFVTDFDDHIFVAMDAEAVLFLHNLITNYIKEKDKLVSKTPEVVDKAKQDRTNIMTRDIRQFECKTWHLEPTVRLLYLWGGKELEPVGVDYILQKLGFQHARLTIPKWMQRGCMDPIDKILSLLANRLIVSLKDHK